ncbi:MAG TPA: PhoPQ-activated pathogenicity-related family protein [Tepidisphaeraceae bacterium]|nr:PhoPQ-activated pathogenicity-related family protein [Tepidisphaeraceae bacterium]
MRRNSWRATALLAVILCFALRGSAAQETALDRYVAAPDPSYTFKLVSSQNNGDYKTFVIDMTSQTWLSEKEVDKPVWKHWLTIVVPDHVKSGTALLLINGGSNDRPAPEAADPTVATAAALTGSVVADLRGIPSEPLVFTDDGKRRTEDSIIAYTWNKFLTTGDDRWPARLPMTKASVRAMDTVQKFCGSDSAGNVKVDTFVVAGGSKRGWTTWTTAAVDKRVIAIVPIVIDTLNLEGQDGRQLAAYGSFSPAVKDYTDIDLARWQGTPQFHALMNIEDPYSYRDRYTIPKLLINSTGDQYFMPDNSQFYFDALPGPKYLRYVPNTDHSLARSDARQTLLAFYGAFLQHKEMPKFSWKFEDDRIVVSSTSKPDKVRLWQATNPNARDFRLAVLGPKWVSTDLTEEGSGAHVYTAKLEKPEKGWTASFIELTFPNGNLPPLKLTTQVRVVPDTYPFADKLKELAGHREAGGR